MSNNNNKHNLHFTLYEQHKIKNNLFYVELSARLCGILKSNYLRGIYSVQYQLHHLIIYSI